MSDSGKADPENTVLLISCGLWGAVLLTAVGYFLHGPLSAAMGGLMGVVLALHAFQSGTLQRLVAHNVSSKKPPRSEMIDWRRLLDYEKYSFAQQMESEGYDEQAEEIYRHLVRHDFPDSAPLMRLAGIYRRRGQHDTELSILQEALTRLGNADEHAAPITRSATRRELEELCRHAEERLANGHPVDGDGSPASSTPSPRAPDDPR